MHEKWNTRLIGSIRKRAKDPSKAKDPDHIRGLEECFNATMAEEKLGMVMGPFNYDEVKEQLKGKNIRAMRRFPQYRFPGAPARPCDNARENESNLAHTKYERLLTENSDFPMRAANLIYDLLPGACSAKLSINDLKKAYRQIPSGHPHYTVVALWDPYSKRVVFFICLGLPFGCSISVIQFNRPMEALQTIMRRLLGIITAHYYDDWANVSTGYSAKSDDDTLQQLHSTLGFILDMGKHLKPGNNPFLGVQYNFDNFRDGIVTISIKPDRITKLNSAIHSVLTQDYMYSGTASSLRGKLYFATTQCFGRVGRAALQPLVSRQYSPYFHMTDAIKDSLHFFLILIQRNPPRSHRLYKRNRSHLIIWTDASWEDGAGIIGILVYDPETNTFYYSALHVPAWMLDRWVAKAQQIGQAEILAAILPYTSLPLHMIANRNVLHFIDNTSAISGMLKGYSAAPDSAWMVNIFHTYNTQLHSNIWYEHVDSKANPADLPSRLLFGYLAFGLRAVWFDCVLDEATWSRPIYEWFEPPMPNPP